MDDPLDPFDDLLVSDDPLVAPPLSPANTTVMIPTPTHTHGSVGSLREGRADSYISAISETADVSEVLPEAAPEPAEPEPEPEPPKPVRPPCEQPCATVAAI